MSIELMTKCARCGDMVPFERRPATGDPSAPGLVFGRFNSKGRIEFLTSEATVLCDRCHDAVRTLIFGDGEEDADA